MRSFACSTSSALTALAQAAGVPTPKFWVADTRETNCRTEARVGLPPDPQADLGAQIQQEIQRTLYQSLTDLDELLVPLIQSDGAGIQTFLVEMIPGPDDKLCSYYTYLDENGHNLIDFTKRVIRRYPMNMGGSTYHITDYVPDIQELALALFRQLACVGWRTLSSRWMKGMASSN